MSYRRIVMYIYRCPRPVVGVVERRSANMKPSLGVFATQKRGVAQKAAREAASLETEENVKIRAAIPAFRRRRRFIVIEVVMMMMMMRSLVARGRGERHHLKRQP